MVLFRIHFLLFTLATTFIPVEGTLGKIITTHRSLLEGASTKSNSSELSTGDVIKMLMPLKEEEALLQLYVLYDLENEGAANDLPLQLSREFVAVVMYQFTETVQNLRTLLAPTAGTTILLMFCTPPDILILFQKVKERRLPSHFVHWLLILDESEVQDDFVLSLERLIYEGTRVTVVAKQFEGGFKLLSAQVDNNGVLRFFNIGQGEGQSIMRDQLLHLIVSDNRHLYSDMVGREMRVSSLEYWPYIVFGRTSSDGSVELVSGLDVSILKTLSQFLNFTYRAVPPEDGEWGNPKADGTVTGMVGDVATRDAHFAMSAIAPTVKREVVIDFSFHYFSDSMSIFSRAPKQRNRIFAIISPFSFQVWICLTASVLSVGPVLYILSKLRKSGIEKSNTGWDDFQSYYFNTFRSLVIQGNLIGAPHWPHRFAFFFWYLFCLNVSALYSGMLTAVLAIPSYETPIDFLTDLPKAVEDGFTLGIESGTYPQYFLQDAKDGLFKEIWESFNHDNPSESFVKDDITGIKRILERKYVYLGFLTECMGLAAGLGRNKFHFARETFLSAGAGIAFPQGAPYKESFDFWLMKMIEGGLIDKWLADEMATIPQKITDDEDSTTSAFSLSHLQAAFFLIFIGCSVAALFLFMETIIFYFAYLQR